MSEDRGLRVDWPRCRAHGVCAEALPELVWLDPWGYPVIGADEVPAGLMGHARRAVRSCPELALRLVDTSPPDAVASRPASQRRTSARS